MDGGENRINVTSPSTMLTVSGLSAQGPLITRNTDLLLVNAGRQTTTIDASLCPPQRWLSLSMAAPANDVIIGGRGADNLIRRDGNDTVTGGAAGTPRFSAPAMTSSSGTPATAATWSTAGPQRLAPFIGSDGNGSSISRPMSQHVLGDPRCTCCLDGSQQHRECGDHGHGGNDLITAGNACRTQNLDDRRARAMTRSSAATATMC